MILLFTSAIASAFAECRRELERLKKELVVSTEPLQTLEAKISYINSLKDEIISLKDTVIKRLQEEKERLYDTCPQLVNRVAGTECSHDVLEQYGRRNNLVVSGIPDKTQNSTQP